MTVEITADATPGCGDADFVNTATAYATNAMEQTASAPLDVQNTNGAELCDGKDNNCNGQVDEGAGLCDDGNACTVDAAAASTAARTSDPGCVPCGEADGTAGRRQRLHGATCVERRLRDDTAPGLRAVPRRRRN